MEVFMNYSDVRITIFDSLESVGILLDDNIRNDETKDINLSDLIEDSVQWISLIIELETVLNMSWPDDLLTINNFDSLNALTTTVCALLS